MKLILKIILMNKIKTQILNQGKLCKRIVVGAKFKNFIIAAFSF
jgi:hypothetical protein